MVMEVGTATVDVACDAKAAVQVFNVASESYKAKGGSFHLDPPIFFRCRDLEAVPIR